jgi:beta-glucosidase
MAETYLPAFEALVREAGVESVMGAYNRTNGEPCCASSDLMRRLRGDWGFQGHFVSDCWAIRDFHEGHHVTDNPVDSAAMALNAGCDLLLGLYDLPGTVRALEQAVDSGALSPEALDQHVMRVLTMKLEYGLLPDAD